jgi:diguanylate cyclase (GGDEF)-like protein
VADAYFPRLSPYADLLWSMTYLAAAALAATWRPPAADGPTPQPRIARRTSLLCFNLTLATMVAASAVLGLRLVDSTRVVGLAGGAIVLFSFAIRSALMQDAQEETLAKLQESRAELRRQALYDELTGLPNRRLLGDRVGQALAGAKRDGSTLALLYIDLDGFKPVNDMFGHAVGDQALVEVACRLRSATRESDTVARMGGDEFVLLMTHGPERGNTEKRARAILHTLTEPMEISERTITVTASMGIGLFPEDATDCDSLIEHADRAMYAAKRQGNCGVQFYSPELDSVRLTSPGDISPPVAEPLAASPADA